jgi:hypothetical protein
MYIDNPNLETVLWLSKLTHISHEAIANGNEGDAKKEPDLDTRCK